MTKSKKIRNGPDLGKYIRKKHRYATYLDASRLFSIPYYSLVRIAKEANAMYHIKKIVLVNTQIIDEYLERFRDEEEE